MANKNKKKRKTNTIWRLGNVLLLDICTISGKAHQGMEQNVAVTPL